MNPRTLFLPALLLVLSSVGCGRAVGSLAGKVTLNGEPLPGGQVVAYNDKDEAVARVTVIDGTYTMPDLPLGAVRLAVQTHTPDGQPIGSAMAPPKKEERPLPPEIRKDMTKALPTGAQQELKPVPIKYTSAKQSGLQTTVVKGETTFDIEMTGKGEILRLPMPGPGGGPPGGGPPGGGPPGGLPGLPPGGPPGLPPGAPVPGR
jgi:hypothetical protein